MAGRLLSALPGLLGKARNTVFSDHIRKGFGITSNKNTMCSDHIIRGFGIASNRNTVFSDQSMRGFGIASHRNTVFSDFSRRGFSVSSPLMDRTHVNWVAKEQVAVINVNDPTSGVKNRWSGHMQKEMMEVMDEIWTDDAIKCAVVVSSKPHCFIVGVDINKIQACKSAEEATLLSQEWQKMLVRIENSPKPIVAAINGWCLNGGLEFAMACQFRMATRSSMTYLGSQEVMLGLIPSAGGTQRLNKLIGPVLAIDYMISAKLIRADLAKRIGLVHDVFDPMEPGILEALARKFAFASVNKSIPLHSLSNDKLKPEDYYYSSPRVTDKMYTDMWELHLDLGVPLHAYLKIIETVNAGMDDGPVAGYQAESQSFGELTMKNDTQARIREHLKRLEQSMW